MSRANFKQLDAFVAINDAQSFQAAARQLGLSQAAVSKHIHEFEDGFRKPLLDRSGRQARLTLEGFEALERAREILHLRDVIRACLTDRQARHSTLRVGLTELAALTWLPAFMQETTHLLPDLTLEISVDLGIPLMQRLHANELDLLFLPNVQRHARVLSTPLSNVRNGWFCGTDTPIPGTRMKAVQLSEHTLLIQTQYSTAGMIIGRWLAQHAVFPKKIFSCDSLAALAGMAVSGLGVAMLPRAVSAPLTATGLLREIDIQPGLRPIPYCAMTRPEPRTHLMQQVVAIARRVCDFDTPYHTAMRPDLDSPLHAQHP